MPGVSFATDFANKTKKKHLTHPRMVEGWLSNNGLPHNHKTSTEGPPPPEETETNVIYQRKFPLSLGLTHPPTRRA